MLEEKAPAALRGPHALKRGRRKLTLLALVRGERRGMLEQRLAGKRGPNRHRVFGVVRCDVKRTTHHQPARELSNECGLDEPPASMAPLRPGVGEIDPESLDGFVVERFPNRPRGVDAEQPHVAKIGMGKPPGHFEDPFERKFDADDGPARISASQLGQELAVAKPDVDV